MESLQEKSIFEDRDALLRIYEERWHDARCTADREWANAKFYITIITSLLALSIAFGHYFDWYSIITKVMVTFLLVVGIMFSFMAIRVTKRHYRAQLTDFVIINKIRKLIGLDNEYSFEGYPQDKYLFPKDWVTHKNIKSGEDFVKKNLQLRGRSECSINDYLYLLFLEFAILFGMFITVIWIIPIA